jgi:twitching motility protein PilI
MSTVLAESNRLMLPSEALKRSFDLPDGLLPGQPAPQQEAGQISMHAVLIGNIGLLLPDDALSELVDHGAVCRLPNTSTWFSGITSVRGNMIPVFDLHELFDIDYGQLKRRMIVVGENEKAVAFWVDDFPRIVTLAVEDGMSGAPPIPALIRDHSRQYYFKEGQVWVDWNIETFVTTLGEML